MSPSEELLKLSLFQLIFLLVRALTTFLTGVHNSLTGVLKCNRWARYRAPLLSSRTKVVHPPHHSMTKSKTSETQYHNNRSLRM